MTEDLDVIDPADLAATSIDLAVCHIEKFFTGRKWHLGGPIPRGLLRSPRYIDYVLGLDVYNGIQYIYAMLAERAADVHNGNVPGDVKYTLELLETCSRHKIPKCFAVGIVIMYLELCEGRRCPHRQVPHH